jgi:hypothetical protein
MVMKSDAQNKSVVWGSIVLLINIYIFMDFWLYYFHILFSFKINQFVS